MTRLRDDLRAYAGHVRACATCKRANVASDLCPTGGALWDAVDEADTDPGISTRSAPWESGGSDTGPAEGASTGDPDKTPVTPPDLNKGGGR